MSAVAGGADANTALARVAQQGLSHVSADVVRAAALAVWYGHDLIDLRAAGGCYLDDALRLLERLSFYTVVAQDRKKVLLGHARLVRDSIDPARSTDQHAFEEAYRKFLPDLQPLQTRHFAATQRQTN